MVYSPAKSLENTGFIRSSKIAGLGNPREKQG
jgi:hypothetical protein